MIVTAQGHQFVDRNNRSSIQLILVVNWFPAELTINSVKITKAGDQYIGFSIT